MANLKKNHDFQDSRDFSGNDHSDYCYFRRKFQKLCIKKQGFTLVITLMISPQISQNSAYV